MLIINYRSISGENLLPFKDNLEEIITRTDE
jgi:hypothetical protein